MQATPDERSESARDDFGKFIRQFLPEIKTLIGKLEKILIKLYRQNVSLLFNQTCLNERLLPTHTHTHTHTHTYTGWNDKIVVLRKTTLQLYFKTFIEKINSGNLIM